MIPFILVGGAFLWALGIFVAMSLLAVAKQADERAEQLRELELARSPGGSPLPDEEYMAEMEEAQA